MALSGAGRRLLRTRDGAERASRDGFVQPGPKRPHWVREAKIETAYTQPGKPRQNGLDESFDAWLRNECLDAERFAARDEAMPRR